MTPESASFSNGQVRVEVIDLAHKVVDEDMKAGPAILGASSERILVHRKALMAIMSEARFLRQRNKDLQQGIDEAGKENDTLSNVCQMALNRVAELEGKPLPYPRPEA